jgi:hypothetical protein
MNPTLENTRALGVGETLKAGDFIRIDEDYIPVDREHIGDIINGDEDLDFVRLTSIDPLEALADAYGIETDMGREALRIAVDNIQVMDSKQRDYGSNNIAAFGEYGVLVRTWDKVSRLKNLLQNNNEPKHESIEDSWLDLANYAIIGVLCRRNLWK